jgi:hypothetical protein
MTNTLQILDTVIYEYVNIYLSFSFPCNLTVCRDTDWHDFYDIAFKIKYVYSLRVRPLSLKKNSGCTYGVNPESYVSEGTN